MHECKFAMALCNALHTHTRQRYPASNGWLLMTTFGHLLRLVCSFVVVVVVVVIVVVVVDLVERKTRPVLLG